MAAVDQPLVLLPNFSMTRALKDCRITNWPGQTFHNDEFDDAIRSIVLWHTNPGTHGMMPAGTTVESTTLVEKDTIGSLNW